MEWLRPVNHRLTNSLVIAMITSLLLLERCLARGNFLQRYKSVSTWKFQGCFVMSCHLMNSLFNDVFSAVSLAIQIYWNKEKILLTKTGTKTGTLHSFPLKREKSTLTNFTLIQMPPAKVEKRKPSKILSKSLNFGLSRKISIAEIRGECKGLRTEQEFRLNTFEQCGTHL